MKDCKGLFKPEDGTFLPDLGSAASVRVVALGEEDLPPRGTSREAAGRDSLRTQRNEPAPLLSSTRGTMADWAFEQDKNGEKWEKLIWTGKRRMGRARRGHRALPARHQCSG